MERVLDRTRLSGLEKDQILMGLDDAQARNPGTMDFFRFWTTMAPENPRVLSYFNNGERRFLHIANDDLMRSLGAYNRVVRDVEGLRTFVRFWGEGAQAFQYAITRDPEFSLFTSLMTDLPTATVYSNLRRPGDYIPGLGAAQVGSLDRAFRGARVLVDQDRTLFREAVANGVLYSGLASHSANNSRFVQYLARHNIEATNIFGLSPEQDRRLAQRLAIGLRNTAATARTVADLVPESIEAAPRLGEWQLQRQAVGDTPLAAHRAIQNNIDFRRSGANEGLNELMRTIPFLRAGNNVMYRLWRSRDPFGGDFFEGQAAGQVRQGNTYNSLVKGSMVVGLPIIALALHNLDDPRYEQLNDHDRKLFMHFWVGDQHFRVRKTEDLAQFSNFTEHALRLWRREDLTGYERFRRLFQEGALDQLPGGIRQAGDPQDVISNYIPYGIRTPVNWFLNNNPISNAPLRTRGLEALGGGRQEYAEGITNPLARALGETFDMSPTAIDFFARDIFGPLWKYTSDAYRLGSNSHNRGVNDLPLARRFMRDAIEDMRTSNWAEKYNQLTSEVHDASVRIREFQQRGRQDAVQTFTNQPSTSRDNLLLQAAPLVRASEARLTQLRNDYNRTFNNQVDQSTGRRMFEVDANNNLTARGNAARRDALNNITLAIAAQQYATSRQILQTLRDRGY
jgi:hypothetical protein